MCLYTGHTVVLRQFGAPFSDMAREFLAAWRDRTVRCLLLEDLDEIARYNGTANGTASELRIFKSNLAVLPLAGAPMQWRLAEIDALRFDDAAWQIVAESGGERLVLGRLAKKTDEAWGTLSGALDLLHTGVAGALHDVFPFLGPEPLRRLQALMPEGRSAALPDLAAIDPRLPDALIARAVDAALRPYFDALRARAVGPLFAGFKFIRADGTETGASETGDDPAPEPPSASSDEAPLFFWFFFPLPGNLAAWEATTGTSRATYFFKTGGDLAQAVRRITRGLALINFRREPVYLSDHFLEQLPKFRRYAIGARKLPDLRALRAAYAGRAMHTSLEEWTAQVAAIR